MTKKEKEAVTQIKKWLQMGYLTEIKAEEIIERIVRKEYQRG